MFLNQILDDGKPDQSALPARFVIVDLETTGFSPDRDEIIEIGALRMDRQAGERAVFQTLIRPSCPIPSRVAQVTGLTALLLEARGVPLAEALVQFLDFLRDWRLVFFNAPFDMGFLERALETCGLPPVTNRVICISRMARQAWPGLPSYKLNQLAKTGGLSVDGSHRALRDCEIALEVYTAAAFELHRGHE